MKYLDFILQQYLQLSNKYFNQNKKSPLFNDGNTSLLSKKRQNILSGRPNLRVKAEGTRTLKIPH